MTKKGKAFSGRKSKSDRPVGDFYHTPKSLVWVAENIIMDEFRTDIIFDPCTGKGSIAQEVENFGYSVVENDLYTGDNKQVYKEDYLEIDIKTVGMQFNNHIITNPPFSLFDKFVNKAKTHCKKFMFIGRLNYLGTYDRYKNGLFNNLKAAYPFNRYVDYQTEYRTDGKFHVGQMATAWFLWDLEYKGLPTIKQLDVQQYATLGAFKK